MKHQKKHKAPGYADLFLDTLKVIASHGGSASNEEIHDGVVERRKFSDDVVDELHPGSTVTTELAYNLAWARTYLCKSGFMDDGNGFMDKLAEYRIGLTPRTEYDIDEEYFSSISAETEGM